MMSERLTSRWTESLDEAFGFTGKKGRLGEEFMCNVFESWGWDYKHFPDDKKKQLSGIDIEFKNPEWRKFYSCDVKNNMNEYGVFYVEKKWLFKTKADRIFHVNPDTGWIAWYSVDDMREWFSGDYDLVKLIPSKTPKFVKRTKVEANA
jgi:hypothetical protein